MKKFCTVLITLVIVALLSVLFSCKDYRNNDSDSHLTNEESSNSDLKEDNQENTSEIEIDYTEVFFNDWNVVSSNLENNLIILDYPDELENLESFIESADFEITNYYDGNNNELDDISKILFKDKTLHIKTTSGNKSLYAQFFDDQLVLLTTNKGNPQMEIIPIDFSVSQNADLTLDSSMIFTEDDVIPTEFINRLKLNEEYVNNLIDKAAELLEYPELLDLKEVEIYLRLDKYDSGVLILEIKHKNLGKFYAEIMLEGLITGNGTVFVTLSNKEKQIFYISAELREFEVQSINFDMLYEETSIALSADNSLIELIIVDEGELITILCEQRESEIEGLYDYSFDIEADDGSFLKIDAKATHKKEEAFEYSVDVKYKDEDREVSDTLLFNSPSKDEFVLSPSEQKCINRYNTYRKYQTVIDNRALYFASNGIAYFQNNRLAQLSISSNPTQYYYWDDVYDIVYVATFEYDASENVIIYYTNVVFNYENNLYFAHRVKTDFENAEPSTLEIELQEFHNNAVLAYENHLNEYRPFSSSNYAYYYVEEHGVYFVTKIGSENEFTYTTEKPTGKNLYGELCEMKYVNGELVYHNLEFFEIDSDCRVVHKCSICYRTRLLYDMEHDTVDEIISEESDISPKITVSDCKRCGGKFINVGEEFSMRIEKASEELLNSLIPLLSGNELSIDNAEAYYEITEIIVKNPTDKMDIIIPKIDKYNIISLTNFSSDNVKKCHFGEISLPEGIYSIGRRAFEGESFDSITLPTSLVSIDSFAFFNCSFDKFTIPKGVKKVGTQFIDNNNKLTELIVDCDDLEYLKVPDSCINLDTINLIGTVRQLAIGTINIKEITLNEGIELFSCDSNTYIERIVFPNTAENLKEVSFKNCYNLKEVILPHGLKSLSTNAFYKCYALKKLIIPSTVTEIGSYAFYGTSDLEITVPVSVTNISNLAFKNASVKIIYEGTQEQWDALNVNLNENCTVVCQN